MQPGFAFFDTALGRCGIAWTERGVSGVSLPGGGPARVAARLSARCGGTAAAHPDPAIVKVIERLTDLLAGTRDHLDDIVLDIEDQPAFDISVYAAARRVGCGRVTTYGAIATELGDPLRAQAVGAALGRNPVPLIVPCHRVLAAGGRSGGFSAPGGIATKRRLLAIENARASEEPDLFDLGARLADPDRSQRVSSTLFDPRASRPAPRG